MGAASAVRECSSFALVPVQDADFLQFSAMSRDLCLELGDFQWLSDTVSLVNKVGFAEDAESRHRRGIP